MAQKLGKFRGYVSRARTVELENLRARLRSKVLKQGAAAGILSITLVGTVAGLIVVITSGAAVPLIISTSTPIAVKFAVILKNVLGAGRALRRIQIIEEELARRNSHASHLTA
ncbi:hypothetical protein KFL_002770080 [Klebsormidium nitens]|uniref:Uncharacterized protein n=1 Tax=Klebsormidium nitens TaxID=105231 RepID=A0A1Y1IAT2_KLENI|nr:hypothetical protein KFL_002770080 [Klebsormidium nitens]|eukprot:GAQ86231.1 hypothetical protein KFL_002770080 [Klebsormidium nitens]